MTTSDRIASVTDDDSTLVSLGYRQQLKRSLGFVSMFTVSFSVIGYPSPGSVISGAPALSAPDLDG